MNAALSKAVYEKRMAYNQYLRQKGNRHLWEKYRKARNHFVKMNRISMRNYFKKRCSDGVQSKSFWDTIKPYFTDKIANQAPIMLRENDEIISDSKQVAELFNNYFRDAALKVGQSPDESSLSLSDIIDKYKDHQSIRAISEHSSCAEQDFNFQNVTVDQVEKMLSHINKKKSTGYDALPSKILKIASEALAPSLTSLVNNVINESRFPDAVSVSI